jgi:hypothetical protein
MAPRVEPDGPFGAQPCRVVLESGRACLAASLLAVGVQLGLFIVGGVWSETTNLDSPPHPADRVAIPTSVEVPPGADPASRYPKDHWLGLVNAWPFVARIDWHSRAMSRLDFLISHAHQLLSGKKRTLGR